MTPLTIILLIILVVALLGGGWVGWGPGQGYGYPGYRPYYIGGGVIWLVVLILVLLMLTGRM